MSYKNNIDMQKEVLERNIQRLNELLSDKLGYKVHLQLEVKNDRALRTCYKLYDNTNIRDLCGAIKYAFKEVTIGSWGIYWDDDYVVINFHYFYTHPQGGSNGAELCSVLIELIEEDKITIIK